MSVNLPPNRNNTILYVLLSTMMCLFSIVIVITIIKWVNEGLYIPESAPSSVKFSHTANAKLIGVPKLDTLNRVSEATCLDTCDKDPICMSVSYAPDEKNCLLYAFSATVDPTLLKPESNGWDYYEKRYFWHRFGPEMSGSFEDYGALDVIENNIETKKDCAIKCINKSDRPKCMGINYDVSTQRCKLVGIPYKGNESNIDNTDSGVYQELLFRPEPKKVEDKTPETPASKESFMTHKGYDNTKRFWSIAFILMIGLWIFRR